MFESFVSYSYRIFSSALSVLCNTSDYPPCSGTLTVAGGQLLIASYYLSVAHPRIKKEGGPAEFSSKKGEGPTTYLGQFVLEIDKIFSKKGGGGGGGEEERGSGPPGHPLWICPCQLQPQHSWNNYEPQLPEHFRNLRGACCPFIQIVSYYPLINPLPNERETQSAVVVMLTADPRI